mgnify:CR=1 FL=1
MIKLRIIKQKKADKIQDKLMARGSIEPMNQKIGNVVLESHVDYRGKDNSGMIVIRNDRTKPEKLRLNGWTYQGTRKSYGPRTKNWNNWNMLAPVGSSLLNR